MKEPLSLNNNLYNNAMHHAIDSSFEILANKLGDKLIELEQIHKKDAIILKNFLYTTELMDQFAEELDFILYANKNKIKKEMKHSILNHLVLLKSTSL